MRWLSLLLLTAVLAGPAVATATVRYVSTTGSNTNSCIASTSLGTPRQTIAAGIACMSTGDTLYLREGTYNESIRTDQLTIPSGISWDNAVTIAGYPNEAVTMTGGILIFTGANLSYVIFDNITLDGFNFNGSPLYLGDAGSHHIRFSNGEIKDSRCTNGAGMIAGGIPYSEILNSRIHDAGAGTSNFPVGCYGMYWTGHHVLVEGNQFYNNAGFAIHNYNSGHTDASNNVYRNNILHGNCANDGIRAQTLSAVILSNGTDNLFYNNVLYENNCFGSGAAIAVSGTSTHVYNNTVYNNSGKSIEVGPGTETPIVQNNIFWGNGYDPITDDGATGPVYSNNLTTDPQFANAGAHDFRLTAGSATAIDTGTPLAFVPTDILGIARPQGSAYDLGAYEYQSGSPPPALPVPLRVGSIN